MKKITGNLLFRVVVAIILGTIFGFIVPTWIGRIFATFNGLFDELLKFLIPFIIVGLIVPAIAKLRSEEHTSELQSREKLVCRLLLGTKTAPRGSMSGRSGGSLLSLARVSLPPFVGRLPRRSPLSPYATLFRSLGTIFGFIVPTWIGRIFATFNGLFDELLKFLIPFIIVGLIVPAIAKL